MRLAKRAGVGHTSRQAWRDLLGLVTTRLLHCMFCIKRRVNRDGSTRQGGTGLQIELIVKTPTIWLERHVQTDNSCDMRGDGDGWYSRRNGAIRAEKDGAGSAGMFFLMTEAAPVYGAFSDAIVKFIALQYYCSAARGDVAICVVSKRLQVIHCKLRTTFLCAEKERGTYLLRWQ